MTSFKQLNVMISLIAVPSVCLRHGINPKLPHKVNKTRRSWNAYEGKDTKIINAMPKEFRDFLSRDPELCLLKIEDFDEPQVPCTFTTSEPEDTEYMESEIEEAVCQIKQWIGIAKEYLFELKNIITDGQWIWERDGIKQALKERQHAITKAKYYLAEMNSNFAELTLKSKRKQSEATKLEQIRGHIEPSPGPRIARSKKAAPKTKRFEYKILNDLDAANGDTDIAKWYEYWRATLCYKIPKTHGMISILQIIHRESKTLELNTFDEILRIIASAH